MSAKLQLEFRPRIVPTGQRLPLLKAQNTVADKGGLPPHRLLDRHLCDEDYRRSLPDAQRQAIDTAFPLVAAELYAHPARFRHKTFRKGRSIRDSISGWLLSWRELAKFVAPSDIVRPRTGLFIDPQNITREKYRGKSTVVVYPASVIVVHPAAEISGQRGKVHEATGMVLEASRKELLENNARDLLKHSEQRIGPVARGVGGIDGWRRSVVVVPLPSRLLGVAYVAYDLSYETEKLAEGVTLADMRRFAQDEHFTPEALLALPRETIEAARRLTQQPGILF